MPLRYLEQSLPGRKDPLFIELTDEMFENWINEDPDLLKLNKDKLRSDYLTLRPGYFERGTRLFRNFLIIAGFRI